MEPKLRVLSHSTNPAPANVPTRPASVPRTPKPTQAAATLKATAQKRRRTSGGDDEGPSTSGREPVQYPDTRNWADKQAKLDASWAQHYASFCE